MRILLGITGSVAAILGPKLAAQLQSAGHEVRVVLTQSAHYFVQREDFPCEVFTDADEWPGEQYARSEYVLHILLRRWADCLLIAPLSANSLAKLAHGQADNLLTCIARAWDVKRPMVLAPAMNTLMWQHPATASHLKRLNSWLADLQVVQPVHKTLVCGDTGVGALAPLEDIAAACSTKGA